MDQATLDNLRRRSRNTAAISAVGALFIVGSIVFAALQVQYARNEVARAQKELAVLKAKKEGVSADISDLL